MGRTGVTYEDVSRAAKALLARGEDITIINVREELGKTGSFSTIQAHLTAWRAEQQATRITTEDLPQALEDAFRRCIGELWQTSQHIVQADIEHLRKAAHRASEELGRDLSEACAAYDQQSAELARLREQFALTAHERDQASQSASTLAAEKAELERRFEHVVGRLEGQLSEVSGAIEALSTGRKLVQTGAASVKERTPRGRSKKKAS